jgi:hypothetical protein
MKTHHVGGDEILTEPDPSAPQIICVECAVGSEIPMKRVFT